MGSSGNGGGGESSRLPTSVEEYRLLQDELDHAWVRLTDTERAQLDEEAKRRRRANPLWPNVSSDQFDRLIEKLDRNTKAIGRLESALMEPEWGLNMKVRALCSSTDTLRDAIASLEGTVERLCLALEGRPA